MNSIPAWIDTPLFSIPCVQDIPAWIRTKEASTPIRENNHSYFNLYSQELIKIPPYMYNVTDKKKTIKHIAHVAKTKYSLLYLHGYASSPKEQHPLADIISKKLKANTISIRIDGHGTKLGSMHFLSQKRWYLPALEGLAIAQKLGEKVIVISCSTGSTLGLLLAARTNAIQEQCLHICISPNLGLYLGNIVRRFYLHSLVQRTIHFISYCLKNSSAILQAKTKNAFHTSINLLEQPLSSIYPMLDLIHTLWNIQKKIPERFDIPTAVFAQNRDSIVDTFITKQFFKKLANANLVPLPNIPFEHSHVLSGDALSPSTTTHMAQAIIDIIYSHENSTLMGHSTT